MERQDYIPNPKRKKARPGASLKYGEDILVFTLNDELDSESLHRLTLGGGFLIVTNLNMGGINLNASIPHGLNAEVIGRSPDNGRFVEYDYLTTSRELNALSLTRSFGQSLQMTLNKSFSPEELQQKATEMPVLIRAEKAPSPANARFANNCRLKIYANDAWNFVRSEIQDLSGKMIKDTRGSIFT